MPDPNTAYIDPFRAPQDADHPLLRRRPRHRRALLAATRATSPRRPRSTCSSTGIADTAYFGPEPEFFIFDDVRFEPEPNARRSTRSTPSRGRGTPARDEGPNLGYKPRDKEGYFPVPPMDHYQDLRSEMVARRCTSSASRSRLHHHEVAHRRPGRDRHAVRHAAGDGRQADDVQVRRQERGAGSTARRRRSCPSRSSRTTARACTCTSRCGRAASRCSPTRPATPGCPTWPAGTSAACSHHAPAICAFANPDDEQLQAPGAGLRGAGQPRVLASATARRRCRIPLVLDDARRPSALEFRCPDPSCNPYLAFSAMLMAGLDGIQNKIEPPDAARQGPLRPPAGGAGQGAPGAGLARRGARPRSRPTSDFLKAGGVFTDDLIETWIELQARERGRRHPPAPPPLRVRPLLRHLDRFCRSNRSSTVLSAVRDTFLTQI